MNISTERTPLGWYAVDFDDYEPDSDDAGIQGRGETEQEAVDDLLEQLEGDQ